ncbi:hypothetical protein A2U01_0066057, partial [Trifolium medium]|nr:hypothetical protein [Trifolium medium]
MDTVEWPMAATIQPTAAVDKDMVKSTVADMGTMATALDDVVFGLHLDCCLYPCCVHRDPRLCRHECCCYCCCCCGYY